MRTSSTQIPWSLRMTALSKNKHLNHLPFLLNLLIWERSGEWPHPALSVSSTTAFYMWNPILKELWFFVTHPNPSTDFWWHFACEGPEPASTKPYWPKDSAGGRFKYYFIWTMTANSPFWHKNNFKIHFNNTFSDRNWWWSSDPMQRERNKTVLGKFFMVYCNANIKMFISSKALQIKWGDKYWKRSMSMLKEL